MARVFDFRASGTRSGLLGGALESGGVVQHTAMCAGKANSLVMFIARDKIVGVDKAINEYFSASEAEIFAAENPRQPTRPTGPPTDAELAPLRRADDASLVRVCGTFLRQNGNFRNSVSCKSRRVTDFCDQFRASDPECPAIVAELKREVPNLGGLTYDGSRPVSLCQHNPNAAGCKRLRREQDPDLARKDQSTGPVAPTPDVPVPELLSILENCLSRKLGYYRRPDNRDTYGGAAAAPYGNTLTYSSGRLTAMPPAEREFTLETAVARHAQEQHDRLFGVRAGSANPRFRIDQIVGFLDRCRRDTASIPDPKSGAADEPRRLYGKFVGANVTSAQVHEFGVGYVVTLVPDSLESGR